MTIAAVPLSRVYALALAALFMSLVHGVAAPPTEMDFAALQADAKKSFKQGIKPLHEACCTNYQGALLGFGL